MGLGRHFVQEIPCMGKAWLDKYERKSGGVIWHVSLAGTPTASTAA